MVSGVLITGLIGLILFPNAVGWTKATPVLSGILTYGQIGGILATVAQPLIRMYGPIPSLGHKLNQRSRVERRLDDGSIPCFSKRIQRKGRRQ